MNLLQKTNELSEHNKQFIITQTEKLQAYQPNEEEVQKAEKSFKEGKILTAEESRQLAEVEAYHIRQEKYNTLVTSPLCKKFHCDTWEAKQLRQCVILNIPSVIGKMSNEDKAEILTAAHNYINATHSWEHCDGSDCNHYGSVMLARQDMYSEKLEEIKQKYLLTKFKYHYDLNLLAICLLEEESEEIRLQTA